MTIQATPEEGGNGPVTAADCASAGTGMGDMERGRGTARPIFVIGPLRSGASLMALSLGQHPNIAPVPDATWIERFAIGVQQTCNEDAAWDDRSQLAAMGVDADRFFSQFGTAIDQLMLGPRIERTAPPSGSPATGPPYTWRDFGRAATVDSRSVDSYRPTRWVDGCYTHCFIVFALQRLFPAARFIHLVREVDEVVRSLTDPAKGSVYKSRSVLFTARDAYEHWLDAVTACVEAERALGSDAVIRIRRRDLVAAPKATLRRCLDFLEEPFDERCLRPFRPFLASETSTPDAAHAVAPDDVPPELRRQAELLSFVLLEDASPVHPRPGDNATMRQLKAAFMESTTRTPLGGI